MAMNPDTARTARIATTARLVRAATLAGALGLSTGCYTTRPIMGIPDAGTPVVAALNDRGRVAMADSLGQNVERVEGTAVSRQGDSSVVLAVNRVRFISGEETRWRGEQLTFRMSSLRGFEERRFSRARTGALVGLAVGAMVAFIVTRQLVSDGTGGDRDGGGTQPPPAGS
ncbi:MAG: hypothetical protein ACXW61_05435 [Gemmatirosa sp.]